MRGRHLHHGAALTILCSAAAAAECPAGKFTATIASCAALKADYPNSASGVYQMARSDTSISVYCDQDTAGGGWTLVLNQLDPVNDFAGSVSPFRDINVSRPSITAL